MKKLLFNTLFIGLTIVGFAQPTFTEQTVHDINKRFIENPNNDETAPEFVLSGSEGQKLTADQLASGCKPDASLDSPSVFFAV